METNRNGTPPESRLLEILGPHLETLSDDQIAAKIEATESFLSERSRVNVMSEGWPSNAALDAAVLAWQAAQPRGHTVPRSRQARKTIKASPGVLAAAGELDCGPSTRERCSLFQHGVGLARNRTGRWGRRRATSVAGSVVGVTGMGTIAKHVVQGPVSGASGVGRSASPSGACSDVMTPACQTERVSRFRVGSGR